jgi:hypothetical protein
MKEKHHIDGRRVKRAQRGAVAHLQQAVDAAHGELQTRTRRTRRGLLLVALLVTHGALGTLSRQTLGTLARHPGLNNQLLREELGGNVRRAGSGGAEEDRWRGLLLVASVGCRRLSSSSECLACGKPSVLCLRRRFKLHAHSAVLQGVVPL